MKKKVIFIMLFCMLFLHVNSVYALTLTNTNSKTYLRSKQQVLNKYKENQTNNNSYHDLYLIEPDIESGIEGILSENIQNTTLKEINYYRWQYGVNPVSIKNENNYRNQRCTVALSTINKLTHHPKEEYNFLITKFSDKFISDAEEGCKGGDGYSGNASKGGSLNSSIKEYISELNNINEGVGHRYSILDPHAYMTSMGYYNSYGAISMYTSNQIDDYDYYTWPSVGYNPAELLRVNEAWSVVFNSKKYSLNSSITIKAEYGEISAYTPYIINEHYNGISFYLPESIKKNVSALTGKFTTDAEITITISNIKGLADELKYTVIMAGEEQIEDNFDVWYKKTNVQTYGRSSKQINGLKYYVFDGNYDYNLRFTINGKNSNFDIDVENKNIAYYDKNENKLVFLDNGLTYLILKDSNTNKTLNIYISSTGLNKKKEDTIIVENNNYIEKTNIKEEKENIKEYNNIVANKENNNIKKSEIKGDINSDNIINDLDVKLLLLEIYDNKSNDYIEYDLNSDNELNILDVKFLVEINRGKNEKDN